MQNYLSDGAYLGGADKGGYANSCCGPREHDPAIATWKLTWWGNFLLVAIVGLLIWNGVATSAMGYGMLQTQPQLERTTEYTHSMKLSTEGAINGATKFVQTRLAQYPENQSDVWLKQLSDSLSSTNVILKAIEVSVHNASSDVHGLINTVVTTVLKELVPQEDKAKVGQMLDDIASATKKIRDALEKLTPDEIAQGFRSITQLSRDTDDVVAAIKNALSKKT